MTLRIVAALGLAILVCYWVVTYLKNVKPRRLKRLLEEQDERDYWESDWRRTAIRLKYDPEREWNEATTLPESYKAEIRALNLEYREMLMRRNGWSAQDFQDSI